MANGASLVPNIGPLLQSLEQFTPRAREDRRLQLAGLEQQANIGQQRLDIGQQRLDIGAQDLIQEQLATKSAQAIQIGNQAITMFNEDITDINTVLKGDPSNLVNNITRMFGEKKDDPTFNNEDAIELRAQAITDPQGVIDILNRRKEALTARRSDTQNQVDRLSGVAAKRSQARSFKPTEFANGTTVTFDSVGNRSVRDGSGNILTGGEAQTAIDKGVESGILEAAERKEQVGLAGGAAARTTSVINRGVTSAETVGVLKRTLELMNLVETGGIDAISLATKRRLGVETANEGELAFALAKGVLTQLKDTFGAAFTKAEGDLLARIEPSITKSPAANKRLIQRTIDLATRSAKRARRAAKRAGQDDVVADIDELLSQILTTEGFVTVAPQGAIDTTQLTTLQSGLVEQLRATGATDEEINAVLQGQ